jgi:hypothetical protein
MLRWIQAQRFRRMRRVATVLFVLAVAAGVCQTAFAIITGDEGNTPTPDPGWPKGAARIFNHPGRIAYYEWWDTWYSDCRGDAKDLSAVLADFAKLDAKDKQVIVHNGVGNSYKLNIMRDPAKRAEAAVDWIFMVCPSRLEKGSGKSAAEPEEDDAFDLYQFSPPRIDVYTGGHIRWSDVTVPEGLTVVDDRLEAHGFTLADATVLEGIVTDLATKQPVAARIEFVHMNRGPKGERQSTVVGETVADAKGHWALKDAAASGYNVVVKADGYVPKKINPVPDHRQVPGEPGWHSCKCELSRPATVSGQVTDEAGKPLADVDVGLSDSQTCKSDADGRFRLDQVPIGKAAIATGKSGYCFPGGWRKITVPAKDVALKMLRAGQLHVTVDFTGTTRPNEYMVDIEPEGGVAVGSWAGVGEIEANNQTSFHDVSPGKYVLQGHPNPSSDDERTKRVVVEVKGGETAEVTLSAK